MHNSVLEPSRADECSQDVKQIGTGNDSSTNATNDEAAEAGNSADGGFYECNDDNAAELCAESKMSENKMRG